MHSFLGQAFVLVALAATGFGMVAGITAGVRQSLRLLRWTQVAAYVFAAAMLLANLVMVVALLTHDFSVHYVAQVGSRQTPTWVTVVSLWSSLEGSILFWGAMLGAYVAAFTWVHRHEYREYMPFALGTIHFVSAFFALLIAGPANPFGAVFPVPPDGPGPNPLLQNHVLMIVHPPMLYGGYVGMTIPFGIAVAALLRGRLTEGWLKPLRRWTLIPWTLLTIGIVMGGWWAYEVLGWGGYWAWDPVENASLLPWLAATGYLHSTVVQERRRILKAWTLSLVLGAFLLTILGTFMTRSGVFNSVHSFTQSPIGPVFLGFLALCTMVSIALVAGRSHLLESEGRIEAALSRESAFLLNNVLFAVFTFMVFLGTVFPLVTEAVRGVRLSVGEPYFNRMAIPLGMLMVFMMGVGPSLPWGKPKLEVVLKSFVLPLGVGVATSLVLFALGIHGWMPLASFGLCAFAFAVTLREMAQPALERMRRRGEGFVSSFVATLAGNRRRLGGYIVHVFVIMVVVAITGSEGFKRSAEASLAVGEALQIGDYTIRYRETVGREYAHRYSVVALLDVEKDGKPVRVMEPRLNFYARQREPIGTPDVRVMGFSDLYVSLLSYQQDGSSVSIRAYTIPLVPWLWWSLPVMALGSLISLWPRRRVSSSVPRDAAQAASGAA